MTIPTALPLTRRRLLRGLAFGSLASLTPAGFAAGANPDNPAAMARQGVEPLQCLRARVDAQGDDFPALAEAIVGVLVRGEGGRAEFRWGARDSLPWKME